MKWGGSRKGYKKPIVIYKGRKIFLSYPYNNLLTSLSNLFTLMCIVYHVMHLLVYLSTDMLLMVYSPSSFILSSFTFVLLRSSSFRVCPPLR